MSGKNLWNIFKIMQSVGIPYGWAQEDHWRQCCTTLWSRLLTNITNKYTDVKELKNLSKTRKLLKIVLIEIWIYSEIKRQRSNNNDDDLTIDGAAEQDIPAKFSEVYKELYNRGSDEDMV